MATSRSKPESEASVDHEALTGAPIEDDPPKAVEAPAPSAPGATKVVMATGNGAVTLPSGASYFLNPGDSYVVSLEDAQHLITTGQAVEQS